MEKLRLQDKKVADLTKGKWHKEGVDVTKFKAKIMEVDRLYQEAEDAHNAAKAAVKANKDVMTTLLRATFAVLEKVEQPPEPTMVPAGILPAVKEKKTEEEWIPLLQEGQSPDKKGNILAQAKDKLGQIPLHRAVIKHAPLNIVNALIEASEASRWGMAASATGCCLTPRDTE